MVLNLFFKRAATIGNQHIPSIGGYAGQEFQENRHKYGLQAVDFIQCFAAQFAHVRRRGNAHCVRTEFVGNTQVAQQVIGYHRESILAQFIPLELRNQSVHPGCNAVAYFVNHIHAVPNWNAANFKVLCGLNTHISERNGNSHCIATLLVDIQQVLRLTNPVRLGLLVDNVVLNFQAHVGIFKFRRIGSEARENHLTLRTNLHVKRKDVAALVTRKVRRQARCVRDAKTIGAVITARATCVQTRRIRANVHAHERRFAQVLFRVFVQNFEIGFPVINRVSFVVLHEGMQREEHVLVLAQ